MFVLTLMTDSLTVSVNEKFSRLGGGAVFILHAQREVLNSARLLAAKISQRQTQGPAETDEYPALVFYLLSRGVAEWSIMSARRTKRAHHNHQ